jgi:DNA-binding CsgD family transcriptional regulator
MLKYLILLIFIVSVALTSGSVILATRLRNRYRTELFSSILYFLVFIFTFGFYGIWGQVLLKAFLTPYFESGTIERFTNISLLLGLPFLVFAWLMLLRFAGEISGRKYGNWHLSGFLLVNFAIIFTLGRFIAKEQSILPEVLLRYYFICLNILYIIAATLLIIFPKKGRSLIHAYDRKIIAEGIILAMLLQIIPLLFYNISVYIDLAFVVTFFAGNSFLPVYFSYGTLMSPFTEEACGDLSLEEFCRKYDVSPRETDVVREICNGLSNKEIADKLFISLQTVKDHTHRIYIKTNVRSRVQLINLVKEETIPVQLK